MSRPFPVDMPLEPAYRRDVLLAVEVLDAATLERVSHGLKVEAEGLLREPVLNSGGVFVWLREDDAALAAISIDPRTLPYLPERIVAADLRRPRHVVELSPRRSYPFAAGMTVLRAELIESRAGPRQPVRGARAQLRWLDDDGLTWRDAPTRSTTDEAGNFAALLRLAPGELPRVGADGAFTVRLRFVLPDGRERRTPDFPLPPGRVADAPAFAWDELQP